MFRKLVGLFKNENFQESLLGNWDLEKANTK